MTAYNDPSIQSPETAQLRKMLDLPHTLMGGAYAMREAGTKFTPRFEAEDNKSYDARLKMSFLFRAYERTIDLLTGQVFEKPVTGGADPNEVVDIDGRTVTQFSRRSFRNSMIDGSGFILVDTPPLNRDEEGNEIPSSAADGRRAYFTFVKALDLLGLRFDGDKIVEARIMETVMVPSDTNVFLDEEVDQVRVLYPGRWETYRFEKTEDNKPDGAWFLYDDGTSPVPDEILLFPFYFGARVSKFTTSPPLTGLAELNLEHWLSASDQRNILHISRVPIKFGKMLDTDDGGKVIVSSSVMVHSNQPDADFKYVEPTGAAMADGWKDLERLESAMELWGLALIMQQRSGNITATERALTSAQTSPFLGSCALEFQAALNSAEQYRARINGTTPNQYEVNLDFSLLLSAYSTATLLEAFKIRLLDRATVINELKRRDEVSAAVDAVEVAAGLEQDSRVSAGTSMSALGAGILG